MAPMKIKWAIIPPGGKGWLRVIGALPYIENKAEWMDKANRMRQYRRERITQRHSDIIKIQLNDEPYDDDGNPSVELIAIINEISQVVNRFGLDQQWPSLAATIAGGRRLEV